MVFLSVMETDFTSASRERRELLGLRGIMNRTGLSFPLKMIMLIDIHAANRKLKFERSMTSAKHMDIRMKLLGAQKGIVTLNFVVSRHESRRVGVGVAGAPDGGAVRDFQSEEIACHDRKADRSATPEKEC